MLVFMRERVSLAYDSNTSQMLFLRIAMKLKDACSLEEKV